MKTRTLALLAGGSYLVIFFAAVYANFFVLESILADPVGAIQEHGMSVRFGILAFLVTAVCDVAVAWALYELYKEHVLTRLSTYFRILHAAIMGVAVFALPVVFTVTTGEQILQQVFIFNTIWLIGLFFFGFHLLLLGRIVRHIKIISYILILAGAAYIIDTSAHFLLPNYDTFADYFLAMVAVPSIFGEMAFTVWLLVKGGKTQVGKEVV